MTKVVAVALTALMSVGMLAAGSTAATAAETPTITVTEIPDGGGAVTVTGSGFDSTSNGIYVGAAAQGATNFYTAGIGTADAIWVNLGLETTPTRAPMDSTGSFTVTLTLPADDGAKKWAVYTSKAHGGGFTDASQNATANLVYTPPVVVVPTPTPAITVTEIPDGGGAVTVNGTGFAPTAVGIYVTAAPQGYAGLYDTPTAERLTSIAVNTGYTAPTATRAVLNLDGTFTTTVTFPADDGAKKWAIYTSIARNIGITDPSQNTTTNLAYTPPVVVVPTPAITVTEIPDGGGAVTVTGTGFDSTSNGIYVGAAAQGATNFYTAGIDAADTVWVNLGNAVTSTRAPMDSTGSFSITLTLPADNGATKWAVYTSKAHGGGLTNASQNTTTNLVYVTPGEETPPTTTDPEEETPPTTTDPADTAPVTDAVGTGKLGYTYTSVAGGFVTVTGSGFSIDSPGIYVGLAQRGFGDFYAAASTLYQGDAVNVAFGNVVGETGAGRTAPMNADGTFTVTLAVPASASATARAAAVDGAIDSTWAIYTSKAHGQGLTDTSQNATLNFFYQLEVSSAQEVPDLGETVDPDPVVLTPAVIDPTVKPDEATTPVETCVAREVSGATLNWAIKDSFRTYIKGGIANGTWELSSVGDSNGQFVWSNGTGTINTEATRGTVSFPGTVHFTGHAGALDITITNVKLRFSGSAATLTASFNSLALDGTRTTQSNVAFANIAAGSVVTTGSRLSLNGAATTLTSAGATAFGDFYDAGAALAPISLTAPLGATVPCTESTYSSLATTGTDTLGGGLLIAALLVMTGFGGISLARRRRAVRSAESSMI